MAKLQSLKTDPKKVSDGVWKEYSMGIRLLIAGIGNKRYKDMVETLLSPHLHRIRNGLMSAEERLAVLKPAVAKYILLNWENIEDEDGKPIPYSYQKALEFFNDPTLQDLFQFVIESSAEATTYKLAGLEQAKENL